MSIDQHLTKVFDDTKTGRFHTPVNFLLFVTVVAACIAVWYIGWDTLATLIIQMAIVVTVVAGVILSIASFSGDEEQRRRRSLFSGISLLAGVVLTALMWLTSWEIALNALVWGGITMLIFYGTTRAVDAYRDNSSTLWIVAAACLSVGSIAAVLQATIGCLTFVTVLMWLAAGAGLILAVTLSVTSYFTETNEQRTNLLTLAVALVAVSLAVWLVAPAFPSFPAAEKEEPPATAQNDKATGGPAMCVLLFSDRNEGLTEPGDSSAVSRGCLAFTGLCCEFAERQHHHCACGGCFRARISPVRCSRDSACARAGARLSRS